MSYFLIKLLIIIDKHQLKLGAVIAFHNIIFARSGKLNFKSGLIWNNVNTIILKARYFYISLGIEWVDLFDGYTF